MAEFNDINNISSSAFKMCCEPQQKWSYKSHEETTNHADTIPSMKSSNLRGKNNFNMNKQRYM